MTDKKDELQLRATTGQRLYLVADNYNPKIKAIRTAEFREPRKNEYFLSGAIPRAYRAPNDLSSKFHIARLVEVEKIVSYKIVKKY